MNFTEERQFTFEGSFSRVFWDISLSSDREMAEVQLADETGKYQEILFPDDSRPAGKFAVSRSGDTVHIEAYHSSANQTRTFLILSRNGPRR